MKNHISFVYRFISENFEYKTFTASQLAKQLGWMVIDVQYILEELAGYRIIKIYTIIPGVDIYHINYHIPIQKSSVLT